MKYHDNLILQCLLLVVWVINITIGSTNDQEVHWKKIAKDKMQCFLSEIKIFLSQKYSSTDPNFLIFIDPEIFKDLKNKWTMTYDTKSIFDSAGRN